MRAVADGLNEKQQNSDGEEEEGAMALRLSARADFDQIGAPLRAHLRDDTGTA
jgi:hypothetical protein